MLTINPLIAKRREFKGSLRKLPKLRAGESLFVKGPQSEPVDAEEALGDLLSSLSARLTDETPTATGRKRQNRPK